MEADPAPQPRRSAAAALDTNGRIAALLRDLAAVQSSQQSRWGYKRAAKTIMSLAVPIESLERADGTLEKIPNIGPSSERIVREVLETGGSPTVERAVRESQRSSEVERSRGLRANFLSRSEVVAALRARKPGAVASGDYLGDLQMHSVWSDGSQTLDDIVAAGMERGYRFCAVTDHSYGLPVAGGMSMEEVVEQHRAIDRLNAQYGDRFRLLKGIEANIRADGSVDMTADELRQFEIVVAAPHSALRSSADQTARMVRAVRTPGVHILGHPRGRMYGSRPGVAAEWRQVFEAAAEAGVAIEIDGDPARQDIDHELAQVALGAGCVFALDSDAHSTRELAYAETAIAHAQLAGIPADRVINCWPLARLAHWGRDAFRRRRTPSLTVMQGQNRAGSG